MLVFFTFFPCTFPLKIFATKDINILLLVFFIFNTSLLLLQDADSDFGPGREFPCLYHNFCAFHTLNLTKKTKKLKDDLVQLTWFLMKDSFGELGASGMATASWRANFKWEQRSAKKMATKCVSRYQHLIFSSLYYMNDYT